MHALLDQLDTERRAFVQGTSFHIQAYESEDGARFVRRPDGSYSNGSEVYPSIVHLFDALLGPISPAQLYALTAVYHPLVTGRISPDHEPPEMSRSQARAFIIGRGAALSIDDISIEAGKLRFALLGDRTHVSRSPETAPPPPEPEHREFKALVEITYRAEGELSLDAVTAQIRSAMPQLITANGARIEARQVVVEISDDKGGLESA